MSVTATTSDLNPLHTIAEAIRALPPSQDPTERLFITYVDGRFAVQERAQTSPVEHPEQHFPEVLEQIKCRIQTLFQHIVTLEVPEQEAILGQLKRDGEAIRFRAYPACMHDILHRIARVQSTVAVQRTWGEHLSEVRKWLLCPETPPDLGYLQSHFFSQQQLKMLSELFLMECITRNHVQAVQWLLDQGTGVDMRFDQNSRPRAQGTTLLHAVLSELSVTREMAACVLQHPSLAPLYSVEYSLLTPLAMACMNNSPYLDLLPFPRAADFRCLNARREDGHAALDRLFRKSGLLCTVDQVFTRVGCEFDIVSSHPLAFEVAALTGRLEELLSIYQSVPYSEQRQDLLDRMTKIWTTYPDCEISVRSVSDWEHFPSHIEFFSAFLQHVSARGFVCLEYPHHSPLRAIPCAAKPTPEQQRRSHGALMRFISDLLGYEHPYSPLSSMEKNSPLSPMEKTTWRLVCNALATIVVAHHRANPSLTDLEWQALLHFHPVQHESLRRDLYCSLASILRGILETVFPVTCRLYHHIPWGLIQYQLGWDTATADAMRTPIWMEEEDLRDPFDAIMSRFTFEVQYAITMYVRYQETLSLELLPQLFLAADLLKSPHLRDAVVRRCIQDICYGDQSLTPQSFCQRVLPILVANNAISHPADLKQLVDICKQRMPPTWVAEALREPRDSGQLAALAMVFAQLGINIAI